MISDYSNKMRFLLGGLVLILFAAEIRAHVPAISPKTAPSSTGLKTKAPDFVLSNQDGKHFDSKSLRGKVVVLNFIYTTCTDVCPLFTANFAQLQRTLKDRHSSDVFFISITTDPEIDSPKVLKAYAQRYGADFENWAFLTGTEAELKPVWKAFGIRVIRKGRGLIQHTSLTTVIDGRGIRRFNHFGEKWQVKDVLQDVSQLLEEQPKRDN